MEAAAPITEHPLTSYQAIAHARTLHRRDRILSALYADDSLASDSECSKEELAQRRLRRRIENCCASPQVWYLEEEDRPYLSEQRCRSRICPRCAGFRSWDLARRITPLVTAMDSPRFLTLTLASVDGPLRPQIARLTHCFRKLRQTPLWNEHYHGGLSTVEVTWNPKTNRWHPHLHCIVDGDYCLQALLANEWERITKDSRVVHIRMIHGRKNIISYLADYVTKSACSEKIPDPQLVEWSLELHGLRLLNTFGTIRKLPKEEDDYNARGTHDLLGYFEALLHAAHRGDAEAAILCRFLLTPAGSTPRPGSTRIAADDLAQSGNASRRLRTWFRSQEVTTDAQPPPKLHVPTALGGPGQRRLW